MVRKRFHKVRTLGEGGFGHVELATDSDTNQLVAVKYLMNDWSPVALTRFRREIEETKRLQSKRIVRILHYNLEHSPPFYVMPFFPKGSLRDRLEYLRRKRNVVSPSDALQLVLGVLEGLAVAHRNGVHHRDLKPENILLDKNGEFVLSDFGFGEFINRQSAELTQGGGLGTPGYCAPEQWETGKGSPAADIYSLGIILFELLVGETPGRAAGGASNAPSHFDERIPIEIDVLIEGMTADVDLRYSSCGQVRRIIETVLSDRFGIKKPVSVPWGKIAVVGLAAVALFGFFGLFGGGGGKGKAR
ncbi:MAG: serine/threonine-protein kinase [Planctomycetota bacterium]|nr:serine/threonine-protein kinase [Planctomycetota bacterium]